MFGEPLKRWAPPTLEEDGEESFLEAELLKIEGKMLLMRRELRRSGTACVSMSISTFAAGGGAGAGAEASAGAGMCLRAAFEASCFRGGLELGDW